MMRGHYAYYGVTGNIRRLQRFAHHVARVWHKWLSRRSKHGFNWTVMGALLKRHALPPPTIIHRYAATSETFS